jgi:outer membrane protein OmpA-like peptidoglycan-associated protein
MSAQDQDEGTRTAFALLIPLLVLVVGFVVGLGIHKAKGPRAKATVPAEAVAHAHPAVGADASVVVENGVVKFYFASGKADLATGAPEALADAIKAAAAGQKLVVSGFHDATGSAEFNAGLAKQRALAVVEALKTAGVALAHIELKKPEQLMGTGTDAEARRVEVAVQ